MAKRPVLLAMIFLFSPQTYILLPYTNQLVGHVSDLKNPPGNPVDTSGFVHPLAWEMLWEDFEKHPPKFIVDTATPDMHRYAAYAIKRYPQFGQYLKDRYIYDTTVNGAPIYRRVMK